MVVMMDGLPLTKESNCARATISHSGMAGGCTW